MAAIQAAANGARVLICEKNRRIGRKLAITGKGRCNVTNNCPTAELLKNVTGGHKFLYSAFSRFTAQDTMRFFESLSVALKTERGNRVFPVSDKADDIVSALERYLLDLGVEIRTGAVTEIITAEGRACGVRMGGQTISAEAVIVATGGCSYPLTGSTGDGYTFAKALDLAVTKLRPSLTALACPVSLCRECTGLTLKNIGIRLFENDKLIYTDFGELLFTHTGISGPVVLSASAHMRTEGAQYAMEIDLKPALDAETLDKRLLRDFEERRNKAIKNALDALLPAVLRAPLLALTNIPPETPVNTLTRVQRSALVAAMKGLRLAPLKQLDFEHAVVTAGGVALTEIDPKTMAAKRVPGLFFAGEVLDLDAYTGGFNLQIAFSTGYAAGEAAAAYAFANEK
ncbi:MAG: NAD(P)/FAD-dependent oxidoreductase [Clostridia bacterium]|nr:NAD(P)/FAD-dependent oxidoreductase [Clostridia bacterium]